MIFESHSQVALPRLKIISNSFGCCMCWQQDKNYCQRYWCTLSSEIFLVHWNKMHWTDFSILIRLAVKQRTHLTKLFGNRHELFCNYLKHKFAEKNMMFCNSVQNVFQICLWDWTFQWSWWTVRNLRKVSSLCVSEELFMPYSKHRSTLIQFFPGFSVITFKI